jgi:hypothetical protein
MRRWFTALLAFGAAGALGATMLIGSAGGQGSTQKAVFAQLSGAKEIGTNGQRGAGDSNGRGSFTAIVSGRRLCYGITVAGIRTPAAAHVHKARAGSNGNIVIPLKVPRSGNPGTTSGCARAGSSLLSDIRANPGSYYANVHNAAFPGGAVRGQLFSASTRQNK